MTALGVNIKLALAKNKMKGQGAKTQQELAEKIKISRGHLSAIMTGRETPSMKLIGRIAGELNISISDLLKEE